MFIYKAPFENRLQKVHHDKIREKKAKATGQQT